MNMRRAILAIGLIALAGLLAWVAFTPASGTGQAVILGVAAFTLVSAGLLFVWRRVAIVLAALAGAAGFLFGAVLAGLSGFGGQPATLEVVAVIWLGAGVAIFAVIDLVATLISTRSTSG